MAGTIIADTVQGVTVQGTTITDGTNSTSVTNCIKGSAKAWVSFNGSTGVVAFAYNVSSITKNSTGQYVINFTTALASANYVAFGSVDYEPPGTSIGTKSTSSCGMKAYAQGAGYFDPPVFDAMFMQ